MTLWENAVLGRHDDDDFSGVGGFLFIKRIKELASRLVERFDVRARSIDVTAGTLSGGNQQKLILARELETAPKLLVAAQPTRGLDVGAIEFVWRQILEQKAEGRGVLLISAELDEIYALVRPDRHPLRGTDHRRVRARRPRRRGRPRHARRCRGGGIVMATEGTAIPAVRRRAKPRWLEGFLVQGGALIVAFLLSLLIGAIIIMLLRGKSARRLQLDRDIRVP